MNKKLVSGNGSPQNNQLEQFPSAHSQSDSSPMRPLLRKSFLSFLAMLGSVFPSHSKAQTVGDWAKIEDITFIARVDKTVQRYVLMLPGNFDPTKTHDVLVALHGHGSDRWQFAKADRDECKAARTFSQTHGLIFVSPDYRAKTSWMGPKAEADMVQIFEELRTRHKVGRFFLTGGSMGGSSALTFAALHPDLVAGVAAMNPTSNHLEYDQFQDAIAESFGGPKHLVTDEYKRRSPEYWPEKFTMPVAVTTGGKDGLVPPQSTLRLAKVLQSLRRDILVIHREQGGHETNLADATAILDFVWQKSKPTSVSP